MKSSKLNPYFTVVPGSGFSEYKNVVTGETVATMQEANAKNDQIVKSEKLFENILPLKNNRMTPTKSRRALTYPKVNLTKPGAIEELIKVRAEIADMKKVSETAADKFSKNYMQMYEPDLDYGLGSLEVEHDDF
tara:strand:+ start:280 stop:681 length:402 start_codon:yes stop_codon:yes gene_type:complete